MVTVGQALATVEPTRKADQQVASTVTVTSPPPAVFVTTTPQPTAVEEAGLGSVAEVVVNTNSTSPYVVNPNPFLSGALIPAAAIVTGIGMAAWHRLVKLDEKDTHDQSKE